MAEIELTEIHDIQVTRQDGVENPASGWEFIIQKAEQRLSDCAGCGCCENCMMEQPVTKDVNSVGGIDETPDIAGADQVLCALYKLLEAEAREGAIGAHEECDIHILSEAISLIRCFRENEMWGSMDDDGNDMAKAVLAEYELCKAHRKFSSDERKELAARGHALPDGSYPIPDADALRRAAILARSGHGDVAAAKRLIARRAKDLGVRNPLADNDAQKDALEGGVTPETSPEAEQATETEALTKDLVAQMIADANAATAETVKSLAEERDKALAELEVLKSTPIPGGPHLSAPAGARADQSRDDAIRKALHHERQAELTSNDRELSKYHKDKARELRAQFNL